MHHSGISWAGSETSSFCGALLVLEQSEEVLLPLKATCEGRMGVDVGGQPHSRHVFIDGELIKFHSQQLLQPRQQPLCCRWEWPNRLVDINIACLCKDQMCLIFAGILGV